MGTGGSGIQRGLRIGGYLTLVAAILASMAAFTVFHNSVAAAGDPTIAAAGDYGCDPLNPDYNSLDGQECQQKATSDLLVNGGFNAVLALGDQHYCGSLAEYQQAYDPTWGRVKSITHPIPGNHEYLTSGGSTPTTGCDSSNAGAAGYFTYFGSAAGTRGQGWYSFDVGAWHLIALNSNCGDAGGCTPTSPQGLWLASDLAAHPNQCILAYWHIPLFSSGGRAAQNGYWLWQQLYAAHADVVLDGHDHIYERFDPQDANGLADPNGIREFIVGTGGANHTSIAAVAANSVVRNATTFGVLALTLHSGGYSWSFKPSAGTFTDSGSASCHSAAPAPTSSPSLKPSSGASSSPSAPPSSVPPTGGTATFSPTADTYTDASAPTIAHGNFTSLRVDASPAVRSYLRFDVAGVPGLLTSATLRVWANSAQTTGYDAYSVADNSWTENAIVAATAPPFGAKLSSSGKVVAGSYTSVDVTPAVVGNGTLSFGLTTTNSTAISLSSREGTHPPQLLVAYSVSGASSSPTNPPRAAPTATPAPTAAPAPTRSPTPSPNGSPTGATFVAAADSYVDASAATSNFGALTQVRIDGSPLVRTFLRFTVSGASGTVRSAVVRVYANTGQTTGYDLYSVTSSTWGETTITAANAPPFGATRLGSSGKITAGSWTSVDVTSAVTGNATYSFGLSTAAATAVSLSSREGAHPPELIVTWTG